MSTIKANLHQIGSNATASKNIVLEADTSTGDLIISKGVHDGVLTELYRFPNGGGLRDTVSVFNFMSQAQIADALAGTYSEDITTPLQNAINAASTRNLPLDIGAAKLGVSATTGYALSAPSNIIIIGVKGVATIKLLSATVNCAIIGSATSSTHFEVSGVTFDGNKSVVSSVGVTAISLLQATKVLSSHNTFANLNINGGVGGVGMYVTNSTLCNQVVSDFDTFIDIEGNGVQTYYTQSVSITNAIASGMLLSFADVNGQTIPSNDAAKTYIANNSVSCDAAFPSSTSVISLMGNNVECVGNNIVGGGTQITVHEGTTEQLHSYVVCNNTLKDAKGNAIYAVQTSGTSAINSQVSITDNHIYRSLGNGIACVGTYAGSGATNGSLTIANNTIVDNLTSAVAPEQYGSIRLQGVVNASVSGNVIVGPRWGGIICHYDGRNIVIDGNVITDHQGRTTTGSGTSSSQSGGAIFISGGSATSYLGNIIVSNNIVQNYGVQVSPQTGYSRTGGIVVNEAKAQDISIKNNRVQTGNTGGISLLSCVNVNVENNDVTGFYSLALKTPNGVGAGCLLTYGICNKRYGTTADRPALTSLQQGFEYYDASLTKPIWWNGSQWKDVSNATV